MPRRPVEVAGHVVDGPRDVSTMAEADCVLRADLGQVGRRSLGRCDEGMGDLHGLVTPVSVGPVTRPYDTG